MSDFRPISLYNIIYRMITKTIANLLKLVLGRTISETQSAFASIRLISDNIISTYELTDTLQKRSKGSERVDGFGIGHEQGIQSCSKGSTFTLTTLALSVGNCEVSILRM